MTNRDPNWNGKCTSVNSTFVETIQFLLHAAPWLVPSPNAFLSHTVTFSISCNVSIVNTRPRCDAGAAAHASAPPGGPGEPGVGLAPRTVQPGDGRRPRPAAATAAAAAAGEEGGEGGDAAGRHRPGDAERPGAHEHLRQQCPSHGDAEAAPQVRGELSSTPVLHASITTV